MKLSNIKGYNVRNVAGFNVLNNTINAEKLTDDASDQMSEEILEDANLYTDQRVGVMNYNIRKWVTENFAPLSSGE